MYNSYPVITGVGLAVPERCLPNEAFLKETGLGLSPETIVRHVGIEQRYLVEGHGNHASELGAAAAQRALTMAGIEAEQLESIILSTATPDYVSPSTASLVHGIIKASERCSALDINAACAGGVAGLATASDKMMARGQQTTLAIGAEILSYGVNKNDHRTAILFGDGAGAAVLQLQEGAHRPYFAERTTPDKDAIYAPPAGHAKEPGDDDHTLKMNGRVVAGHAKEIMPGLAFDVARQAGLVSRSGAIEWDGIDYFVPHQANKRMIEAMRDGMDIPKEKCIITVDKFGNTSSASVFMALAEARERGEIEGGPKRVVFTSIGAGMVGCAALIDINLA